MDVTVLLIGPSTRDFDSETRRLSRSSATIRTVGPEIGYETACAEQPDMIAIDLSATAGTTWTMCRVLKADPRTSDIPVVIVAGDDHDKGPETIQHARFAGAQAVVARQEWEAACHNDACPASS